MKKIIILITALILTCSAFAQTPACHDEKKTAYSNWVEEFKELQPNMSRLETEKIIEKIREIKSTYDVYAMDISDIVVYKLDQKHVLLVWYKPGTPAPTIITSDGRRKHYPPKDGHYLKHRLIAIR